MDLNNLITYGNGEKKCECCGEPLGEMTCHRSQSRFYCSKSECRYPRGMMVPIQFIAQDKKCDAYGCNNPAEQRAYAASQKFFFCSEQHRIRFMSNHGGLPAKCAHCGKDLGPRRETANGLHFCLGHNAKYFGRLNEISMLGCFLEIYDRYKSEFANDHYRDTKHPLDVVRRFLALVAAEGVKDINCIIGDHIDLFTSQYPGQNGRADFIKVFFDYLIQEELYTNDNPVCPDLHYSEEIRSLPRPYDEVVVANLWRWAGHRGDTRTNLILAFGLEFGPKEIEVLDMRMQDFDLERALVRLRRTNPCRRACKSEEK